MTRRRRRPAVLIAALFCAAACARGREAPGAPASVRIGFRNLDQAWSLVAESSFARALAASGWLERADVKKRKAQLDAAISEAEARFAMPLRAPLAEILRGSGVLVLSEENGARAFAVHLKPAGPVDFHAIVARLIERDPDVVRLRGPGAEGAEFERLRVKGVEFFLRIEADGILAGSSRALAARAAAAPAVPEDACLQVCVDWGPARSPRGLEDAPPLPFERLECTLKATSAGIELAGEARCGDAALAAPFAGAASPRPRLGKASPREAMALAALSVDLKALHGLIERLGAPEERELARRRMEGIASTAFGGRAVPEVLAGLGPEVFVAIGGCGEGGEPAAFALRAAIRTAGAREGLLALGRALCAAAALQEREARMEEEEGRTCFVCALGAHRLAMEVREDLLCVNTSEALARVVRAAATELADEGGAAERPACAAAVDTAALGAWLRRNKALLSEGSARRRGFRRPDEIEAAAVVCEALAGARAALTAEGSSVRFALSLDFPPP